MAAVAPVLYEVEAGPWLARLSARAGRRVTLGDVPDEEIERIASSGFDYLWPIGVWRTGEAAARIARRQRWLRQRWREAFPGATHPEIVGSPFAVAEYRVDEELGGEAGLARLRRRLAEAGLGLILDFVPHQTATDAPWIHEHPDWYVAGSKDQRAADGAAYFDRPIRGLDRWLAHGRDPHFPPWTDTAALDYRVPAVHAAMTDVLGSMTERCDGVRVDMAMLVLADVFRSTWADRSVAPLEAGAAGEFWADAIARVRSAAPGFVLIAEAYWGLEWRLQQLGFDHTYDKTFRDRIVAGDGRLLAAHLRGDEEFQRRSVRFLENHDEPRVAAELPFDRHRAAAVLAATVPGMWLVHDGQLEGARIRAPVQFARWPDEPADPDVRVFYARLLAVLRHSRLRRLASTRLDPAPAWDGNPTHEAFVARLWRKAGEPHLLGVVNLGATQGQCRIRIAGSRLAGRPVALDDLLGDARYEREGEELMVRGLYLDMPSNAYHLFRIG